jgi:tRNA(Ile)-lysidine synthase
MNLPERIAESWPAAEWADVGVLLAVSGGPDSVALLRAMADLKQRVGGVGRLIVGHFNHWLRAEADGDADFVADLAGKLRLGFEQGGGEVRELAKLRGNGVEAAAREARYEFLLRVAEKCGARYVVTGHTADDLVETVLFNFLRGTGLAGLAGTQRVRALNGAVSLMRPMLGVQRADVLLYLQSIEQTYRTDATNLGTEFMRSRLRNELLPMLREKYNADVDGAMLRLSKVAGDAQGLIERMAEKLLERSLIAARSPGGAIPGFVTVRIDSMGNVDRHLVREMFVVLWRRMGWPVQQMGFAEWDGLAGMAQSVGDSPREAGDRESVTKRLFPGRVVVERSGDEIMLRREVS